MSAAGANLRAVHDKPTPGDTAVTPVGESRIRRPETGSAPELLPGRKSARLPGRNVMARQQPSPLAKAGFAIAGAALAFVVLLGLSGQTVDQTDPGGSSSTATVGCGSVFSPKTQPPCDEALSNRENLMMAIGIPGVALGLGIVVAGSRRPGSSVP